MGKKLIIGQSEWGIADDDASSVVKQVRAAMENGTSTELQLVDGAGRAVSVILNPKAVPTVVLDLDQDPRPSEMS
jgi:hypothetical protein